MVSSLVMGLMEAGEAVQCARLSHTYLVKIEPFLLVVVVETFLREEMLARWREVLRSDACRVQSRKI